MIIQRWAASLLHFFDTITLAPWGESVSSGQQTLETVTVHNYKHSPIFEPPNSSPDVAFFCDYTAMGPGWVDCSTSEDRSCWLKGPVGGKYDINTNYEKDYPIGKLRQVWHSHSHVPKPSHVLWIINCAKFEKVLSQSHRNKASTRWCCEQRRQSLQWHIPGSLDS